MRRKNMTLVCAAVAAIVLSAGCTDATADKAGNTRQPRVLVLANNDGDGLVGAPAVARFADRIKELSGGTLAVRVESRWQGGGYEPRVITDVASAQADLGWAGTRAFDMAGNDSFRPLHAPFLINSYAAQAAVVSDPIIRQLTLSRDLIDSKTQENQE